MDCWIRPGQMIFSLTKRYTNTTTKHHRGYRNQSYHVYQKTCIRCSNHQLWWRSFTTISIEWFEGCNRSPRSTEVLLLRESKVGNLSSKLGINENVLRLDTSMNHQRRWKWMGGSRAKVLMVESTVYWKDCSNDQRGRARWNLGILMSKYVTKVFIRCIIINMLHKFLSKGGWWKSVGSKVDGPRWPHQVVAGSKQRGLGTA